MAGVAAAADALAIAPAGREKSEMPAPRIVWPAPLLPALIDGDGSFAILTTRAGEPRDLSDWARTLALVDRRGGRRIEIEPIAVEPCGGDALPGFVHGRLETEREAPLYQIRCRVAPLEIAPRAAAVFDLAAGEEIARRNAVGVLAPGRETLRLAFATDIHVARIWDDLDQAVARHAADLHPTFLHPNRSLDRFVETINRQAARGEIDLVVFGGDLVDHVHDEPRSGSAAAGNVQLFRDAVARLDVPAFAVPGNHDFRLHPWRHRLPNLESVGLPSARTRALLRAAGLWDAWPLRLADRDALATRDAEGRSGLRHHLAEIAPATDFALDLRGLRLVFSSTGRDVFPQWRRLDWPHRRLLLRSAHTSMEDPDCEGLSHAQIRQLGAAAGGTRGVALFQHAPLLHTTGNRPLEQHLSRIELNERDDDSAQLAFERGLHRAGVRHGVFFHNPASFLRALLSSRADTVALCGHVHRGTAALVDRRALTLRSAPMQAPEDDALALFTGPSLSQRRCHRERAQPPGYLFARFDAGRLAQLEQVEP